MRIYKNKQLVARNDEGRAVAYIGIIDKDAFDYEKEVMRRAGYKSVDRVKTRTAEEIEAEKIAAILRGEI